MQRFFEASTPVSSVEARVPNKILLIKAVRTIAGCGLKEAKDIVEGILRTVEVTVTTYPVTEFCDLGHPHEKPEDRVTFHADSGVYGDYPTASFLDAMGTTWPSQ